jgi:hypothetical protein
MCGLAKVAARMEDERLMRWPEELLRPDRAVRAVGRRARGEFELRRSIKRPSGDVLSSGLSRVVGCRRWPSAVHETAGWDDGARSDPGPLQ